MKSHVGSKSIARTVYEMFLWDNEPIFRERLKSSDAQEMRCFYQHYYSKYIEALQNLVDKADRALLMKSYQTAAALFEVLKAVNLTQYLEIQADVIAFRNTRGLPWPKDHEKKLDEDLLDWLHEMFGFQRDTRAIVDRFATDKDNSRCNHCCSQSTTPLNFILNSIYSRPIPHFFALRHFPAANQLSPSSARSSLACSSLLYARSMFACFSHTPARGGAPCSAAFRRSPMSGSPCGSGRSPPGCGRMWAQPTQKGAQTTRMRA
ncbi:Callose synthase 3 [Platanthera guangdongensis]|uniref:Callose synthase 3 n=1 Tax=Platanthera guangdongensis TaxID=2320717 RepID=A0ABR2M489_9ASPA